jgi:transcriptional regulator with XRE-family HTH domain
MNEADNSKGALFPPSVGERLVAARKKKGLTLDEVSERTRIPLRHLETIESGGHEGLPAIPYSAGFVKSYAQLLGLDGLALAHDFRAELSGAEQVRHYPEPMEPADPARVPPRLLATVALVAALVLAVAYLILRGGGMSTDERATLAAGTAPQAATPATGQSAPTQTPAQGAPARPAPGGPVAVTATEAAWVKIYEKDGPTLFMGAMTPGERFDLPATAADPMIWTGRPQAFRITVGQTPIPPLGSPDRTVRDISLKPEALLARASPQNPASPAPPPQPAVAPIPLVTPIDPPAPG